MIINNTNLRTMTVGFNALFQKGREEIRYKNKNIDDWKKITTVTQSTREAEEYGWLDSDSVIREWLGDRVVQRLKTGGMKIVNRDFEGTVGVKKNQILDNRLGDLNIPMRNLGAKVEEFPNKLVFNLLATAQTELCYDGSPFFDTAHKLEKPSGKTMSYSNLAVPSTGAVQPWYLFDTSKLLSAFIYQERQPFNFVAKTSDTDDNVFERKEFLYGTDGRCNVGFGLPQLAFKSTKPLSAATLQEARVSMGKLTHPDGQPMGIYPTLLVVGWDNEEAARNLLRRDEENASTNTYKGIVDLMLSPYVV
jgi:phage major head subunit gpT-like protein